MDQKTFTLANMFAMQLHKYAPEISKIVSGATKELVIEMELKKVGEAWKEQKFTLAKYMKVSHHLGFDQPRLDILRRCPGLPNRPG